MCVGRNVPMWGRPPRPSRQAQRSAGSAQPHVEQRPSSLHQKKASASKNVCHPAQRGTLVSPSPNQTPTSPQPPAQSGRAALQRRVKPLRTNKGFSPGSHPLLKQAPRALSRQNDEPDQLTFEQSSHSAPKNQTRGITNDRKRGATCPSNSTRVIADTH